MSRLFPLLFFLFSSFLYAQEEAEGPFQLAAARPLDFTKNGLSGRWPYLFRDSKGFMWGIDNQFTAMRFDGYQFDLFPHDPEDPTTPSDGKLSIGGETYKFFEDRSGKIWILYSSNENLDCYDPRTEQFKQFRYRLKKACGRGDVTRIHDIYEDQNSSIWIGINFGVFQYFPDSDSLRFFETDYPVNKVFEDIEGNLWFSLFHQFNERRLVRWDTAHEAPGDWIAFPDGVHELVSQNQYAEPCLVDSSILLVVEGELFRFYPLSDTIVDLRGRILERGEKIRDHWAEGDAIWWVTTLDRLLEYHQSENRLFEHYNWSEDSEFTPLTVGRTREGILGVWGMTNGRGSPINFYQVFPPKIRYHTSVRPESIPDPKERNDYVLKWNGEIYFYTPPVLTPVRKGNKTIPPFDLALPGIQDPWELDYQFETDEQGNLWILAARKGKAFIRKYDAAGKLVLDYQSTPSTEEEKRFPGGTPKCIKPDQDGKLWIATWNKGFYMFNPEDQSFHLFRDELTFHSANAVYVDEKNNIWCGIGVQLSHLDQKTGKWRHYNEGNSNLSTSVTCIYEDSDHQLWIGTVTGLYRFDRSTETFYRYGLEKGIELGYVYSIYEDKHKQLWVNQGPFFLYDRKRDVFIWHLWKEGWLNRKVFNPLEDRLGNIYLPTWMFDVFYLKPEKMDLAPNTPPIYFKELLLFNKKVKVGAADGILSQALDYVEEIRLRYEQNDFAIHFTAPEFAYPDDLQFLVKLEGFHKDWQNLGNSREARFTNLSPGKYTFQLKVRNKSLFETETPRTLHITILPPWYRTTWAYALWIALILGSIYTIYRYQLRRRLAIAEAQRLKELDLTKSQLYTNITHEFRTPLTIILGMADQVKSDPKNWFNEGLGLIRRNGKQLLNLVNQMLDLAKLESGQMTLKPINGDIIGYLHYLTESFHSYADSKDIRLHFSSEFKSQDMDYDPEKMQHVIANLLSNAIKFTPAGGDVYLDVKEPKREEQAIILVVRDNGVGIAQEHLPHIFDRFYQVDASATRRGEGTGIGLALTKELIKLMGGRIEAESEPEKGTQFSIWLPISRNAPPAQPDPEAVSLGEAIQLEQPFGPSAPEAPSGDQPLVLLIEDNPDVITYLRSFLGGEYQIETATNGQEGIDKALELIPDLIVSDVMMPEKDGFEVCATLKTDERSSHIPVILLTAKTDDTAKLEGLTHGADAYLAKPFNKDELLIRMEKLIELRQRLQVHYQQAGELVQLKGKPNPTPEDRFLQKLIRIVEEHLSDENFGLPDLCRKAGLSRSQLFRKLKALTGKSTTHFIRSIRLAKAKELLETTDMSISEIAYAVGFSWLNYFSKMFKEEFGVSPTEVRGTHP